MELIPLLAVVAVVLWITDRVLLALELRGWIVYRQMPRVRRGYGMSVMNLDVLLQPERRHVIELKQDGEVHREEDDDGKLKTD